MASKRASNDFLRMIPRRSKWIFVCAVFFVFAPIGLLLASSFEQQRPAWAVATLFGLSGLIAVSWVGAFTVSRWFVAGIVVFTAGIMWLSQHLARVYGAQRSLQGLVEVLLVVAMIVAGYVLFVVFINGQGRTTMRLLTEMALARDIHRTLVPRIELDDPRVEALGVSEASTEMGGDLVDAVRHAGGLELVLADVSGHGVRAGVVMGMIKAAIRTQLRRPRPLGELMAELNDVLEQTTSAELYATMAGFRLAGDDRALVCGFAGHHHAAVFRAGTDRAERVHQRSFPLGMLAGQDYATSRLELGQGDLVAVYTDGLNETADAADDELGHEPIERAIGARRDRPLAEIQRAVFELVERHGPHTDDRTLLLLRMR